MPPMPLRSAPARIATLALLMACHTFGHAADTAAGFAYVSNQNGGIGVIDLATLTATGELDAFGTEPRGIGISGDGRLLVVANRDGGRLAVIERASGKLLRHIRIGANPEFVRTRGNLAFVSFEPSSSGKPPAAAAPHTAPHTAATAGASPASAATGAQASTGPGHDKPDDSKADDDKAPARIAIVDLAKGRVLRTIRGGMQTEGIEFSADGRHILITNEEDNTITVHRIADGQRVKTIDTKPFGERPRGIKMAPDGRHYVATIELGNALVVLDAQYRVVKSVKTGASPYGVAFDRAGQRLFVAAARSKTLQVFDADSFTLLKDVPTGDRCWHFSFTPDDRRILLACGRSNEVVVIDTRTLEVTQRIADGKLPWGIVTWPHAMGSLDRAE